MIESARCPDLFSGLLKSFTMQYPELKFKAHAFIPWILVEGRVDKDTWLKFMKEHFEIKGK